MKKQQSGFTIVEVVLVIVIVAAIAGVGYYVWHGQKATPTTTAATTSAPTYQSPPTSVPPAPPVNSASDLNNAMSALNQAGVSSNNTDNNQLSSQASGF